ncbi:MAG: hypothetical protein ACJAX5_002311 [Patiriisocius sp.]|jgi:hypothetical protein
MTEVHIIQPEEWLSYRDIRLAALKDSPDAFGSTYAESILYTEVAVWVVVWSNQQLIGLRSRVWSKWNWM